MLLIIWNILEKQLSQAASCCFIDQNFKYFLQSQIWCSKLSDTYLIQKQPFVGVYSRLKKKAFSWVFFLLKLQAYSLRQDSARDVFQWVYLIFRNTFFAKDVCVVTASPKYHSFSLLRQNHLQNVTIGLGYVLIILK